MPAVPELDQTDGTPVFVDLSGRRAQWATRVAWTVAGVLVLYLALFVASLTRAPWVPRLTMPGLGPVLPQSTAAPPPSIPGAIEQAQPTPPQEAVVPTSTVTTRVSTGPSSKTSQPTTTTATSAVTSTSTSVVTTTTSKSNGRTTSTTKDHGPSTTHPHP
jgi:hypothetical protein